MTKFDDYFSEPRYFSHGSYVMSGRLTAEEAARQISEYIGEEVSPLSLKAERVRYGFAPQDVIDMSGESCWYTGARGRGSIPVWIYDY